METKYKCDGCGRKHDSAEDVDRCFSTHDCCAARKDRKKGLINGLIYGLVPHTFCILFIVGSILGVTLFTSAFKPFLASKNFFYILIALSFGFATVSALFYLRRNNCLCLSGAGKRWKFLSILYTTTIAVNLLFFLVIFPAVANIGTVSASAGELSNLSSITLNVAIPCSGHAPLIISELKKLPGIKDVKYNGDFVVSYNSDEVSKQDIIAIEIFKEYPAKVVSENVAAAQTLANSPAPSSSGCGGSCGGCGA